MKSPQLSSPDTALALGLAHKFILGREPVAPLVVLVHGRAGDLDVMWTFRRCIPDDCSIIAVQAPLPDPLGGFSWWDATSEKLDIAQAFRAKCMLLSFLERAVSHYQLEPRRRIALGFSQGAGLLSLVLQDSPDSFQGVALLAGFIIKRETAGALAQAETLPSVFIAHGTKDAAVPFDKAVTASTYLRALGFEVELHQDPVAHKVGSGGMRALKEWLERMCGK